MTRVAFFHPPTPTHFRRNREIVRAMVEGGLEVTLFGGETMRGETESAGARFVDMFAGRSPDELDPDSVPTPCRWVSFAGFHGDSVIEEARRADPQVVLVHPYAVVGRVVARALEVPHVIVCVGHNIQARDWLPRIERYPGIRVSDVCRRAADRLRDVYGLEDASPHCWVAPPSPHLNIACEPQEFLNEAEQEAFAPLACFGALTETDMATPVPEQPRFFSENAALKVYASLGMSSWSADGSLLAEGPLSALEAMSAGIAATPGAEGLITLGGGHLPEEVRRDLESSSVRVVERVEQLDVLSEADAFITHNGLHSTHEAVLRGVPMLSYPLWWDQPELAKRCHELGLGLPIAKGPMSPIDAGAVSDALARFQRERQSFAGPLAMARRWEEAVVANRPRVVERIAELANV